MLPPAIYDALQKYINRDFSVSFQYFNSKMQLQANDSVVDIGCGTGLISKRYTERKIKYIGIDSDHQRIKKAQNLNPNAHFIAGDLRDTSIIKQIETKNVILHGVLHHLSDTEVHELYVFLRGAGCVNIATMDPILPDHTLRNPLATFLCKMDQGKHVRHFDEYQQLLSGETAQSDFFVHKNSRWPVKILYTASKFKT